MNGNNNWTTKIEWEGNRNASMLTYHEYKYQIEDVGNLYNPKALNDNSSITEAIRGYNAVTTEIQSVISESASQKKRIRAIGSSWSFSEVLWPGEDGRVINTFNLNLTFPVEKEHILDADKNDKFYFAQCGAKIWHLTNRLEEKKRSLKTSGASNGQTIAGAISTGTHGSALDVGAIQDYIVGLHLIVGPNRHVWLERESQRVVSDDFLRLLGITKKEDRIRNDEIFNAALVSFGSFGFIHGVMIETDKIFLLERFGFLKSFDDKLKKAIHTLDFSELQLPHGSERPYFFSVIVNPHNLERAYVTVMYKQAYDKNYIRRVKEDGSGGLGPGDAIFDFLADLPDKLQIKVINDIFEKRYKGTEEMPSFARGTLGDIFTFTTNPGGFASMAIGVPLEEASKTLEIILKVHDEQKTKNFPGGISLRYVKGSKALLAFTKFPTTCIIELDGVSKNKNTKDNTQKFYENVLSRLDEELKQDGRLQYTLHWGKVNDHLKVPKDGKPRVRWMYGDDTVDRWLESRRALLDESTRQVFSSPFLEACGLAG